MIFGSWELFYPIETGVPRRKDASHLFPLASIVEKYPVAHLLLTNNHPAGPRVRL